MMKTRKQALCSLVLVAGVFVAAGASVKTHAQDGVTTSTPAANNRHLQAVSAALPPCWRFAEPTPVATATGGMVVTAEENATDIGVEILRAGGNAADAVVAICFALAVSLPEAGNIGGGGFLIVRTADGGEAALDFREKAPLAAEPGMFLDNEGNVTDRSLYGPLASGVPGTVMGMVELHRRFGSLDWEDLLQPAIRLAKDGFTITEAHREDFDNLAQILAWFPPERSAPFAAAGETFLPGHAPPAVGTTFRQPDLARTLERIAAHGAEGFYRGETAQLIVEEMRRSGGIISREDLDGYRAIWREPIVFTYRNHRIVTMPPPSSGGVTLAAICQILSGFDLGTLDWSAEKRSHFLAESMKRAYADRNAYLGDPDFVEMPISRMVSAAYGAERREEIRPDQATPSLQVEPGLIPRDMEENHAPSEQEKGEIPSKSGGTSPGWKEPRGATDRKEEGFGSTRGAADGVTHSGEGENTTHISVVDRHGNAVSVTTTINTRFGSLVVVRGAGFLLNNEMDDFTAKPGVPNIYGLVQGEANAIAPGKRMLSSMTPTIVLDPEDRLFLVTGSPGGSKIISTVFQTISNAIDYSFDLSGLIRAPRVHHQHLPDQIVFEYGGLTYDTFVSLQKLGHRLAATDAIGEVQAILRLPDGRFQGAADPRGDGLARGLEVE